MECREYLSKNPLYSTAENDTLPTADMENRTVPMSISPTSPLADGPPIIVAAHGAALGEALSGGLARDGFRVGLLTDGNFPTAENVFRVDTSFDTLKSVGHSFKKLKTEFGMARTVLCSCIPKASLNVATLESFSDTAWKDTVHCGAQSAIYCLRAAYDYFEGLGGSILFFGPSVSLVGGSGLVPLTLLLEAQRALIKAAARQWGVKGIRVNWIAVGERNYPELDQAQLPGAPELGPAPPALGYIPSVYADLSPFISLIASNSSRIITGATFNVDGGYWMVP
jgi:NAD(P)-dependent dehydrogenase (short-subunit alcohol dehydrogenase family)